MDSASKWIFQTAFCLLLMIMMTEGIKCYQCGNPAGNEGCKKGIEKQLRTCTSSLCHLIVHYGWDENKNELGGYVNSGCGDGKPADSEWIGCYSEIGEVKIDGGPGAPYAMLGCTMKKMNGCVSLDWGKHGFKVRSKTCYCENEGCNSHDLSTADAKPGGGDNSTTNSAPHQGQKLTPKSSHDLLFRLTFSFILHVKMMILLN